MGRRHTDNSPPIYTIGHMDSSFTTLGLIALAGGGHVVTAPTDAWGRDLTPDEIEAREAAAMIERNTDD